MIRQVTRLHAIRRRLAGIRRRRAATRWVAAWLAIVALVLWTLVAVFAVDFVFQINVVQRAIVLAIGATAVMLAARRFALPLVKARESELQLALLAQRQLPLPPDLVAALQFDSSAAAQWGSPELRHAVIESVADTPPIAIQAPRACRPSLPRRAGSVLGAAAICTMLAGIYPDYFAAFVHRLLLRSERYPTRTVIQEVDVNDQRIDLLQLRKGDLPAVRAAISHPVKFRVKCSGTAPQQGTISLRSSITGQKHLLELRPSDAAHGSMRSESGAAGETYEAILEHLTEPVECQVLLGDTWTEPIRIESIPLPEVDLRMRVTPPAHLQQTSTTESWETDARQVSVPEGSHVSVTVDSSNGKRLALVQLACSRSGELPQLHALQQDEDDARGNRWVLPAAGTLLAAVEHELRYELHVVDEDGLEPRSPIVGSILLQRDLPPYASVTIAHRVVVPAATPTVRYRVSDDHAVARVDLHVDIERLGEGPMEPVLQNVPAETSDTFAPQRHTYALLPSGEILRAAQLPFDGSQALELALLELSKGDRLKLTLEVADYRGARPGAAFLSEPVFVEVSDEAGVLAAISEADEQIEQRLTEIIDRQLGEAP